MFVVLLKSIAYKRKTFIKKRVLTWTDLENYPCGVGVKKKNLPLFFVLSFRTLCIFYSIGGAMPSRKSVPGF